jgi:hypothetical protein
MLAVVVQTMYLMRLAVVEAQGLLEFLLLLGLLVAMVVLE